MTPTPPRPEPRGLRAMFLLRPAPRTWHVALRTMLSIVVPASVGYATGHLSLGLLAAVGGFASLFGGGRPYGYRTRLLLLVSLGEALAVALGIWAEQVPWLGVLTVTLIAMIATWVCLAFAVVPGAYQFALCCATGTALHAEGADPLQSGLLVLAGGLFATLLQLTGALVDRHGPERQAVARAADRVADFVDAVGGPDADGLQHQAALAMQQAWTVLVAEQPVASRSGHARPAEGLLRLREIGRTLQLVLADAMRRGTPDPGAAGRARQLGWQARRKHGPRQRGVLFALPLGRPHPGRVLLTALEPGSRTFLVLVRVGVAALVSGVLASALGLSHAYWAVATSVLVLATGFDQRRTVQRGLERSAGTVLGVGAVALILRAEPTGPALIAVIAVVIYGAQLLIPRNYTAAAALITCSALLMAVGGSSQDPADLLLARALDTLIGAGVALSVFALVSRKTPAAWLPDALAATVKAAADVVDQLTPDRVVSTAGLRARRELERCVTRLGETSTNNLNGFPAQREAAERLWPVVVAGERLAYRVLAEAYRLEESGSHAGSAPGRARLQQAGPPPSAGLRRLAAGIRHGGRTSGLGDVPSFVSRDVGDLRRVLVG